MNNHTDFQVERSRRLHTLEHRDTLVCTILFFLCVNFLVFSYAQDTHDSVI